MPARDKIANHIPLSTRHDVQYGSGSDATSAKEASTLTESHLATTSRSPGQARTRRAQAPPRPRRRGPAVNISRRSRSTLPPRHARRRRPDGADEAGQPEAGARLSLTGRPFKSGRALCTPGRRQSWRRALSPSLPRRRHGRRALAARRAPAGDGTARGSDARVFVPGQGAVPPAGRRHIFSRNEANDDVSPLPLDTNGTAQPHGQVPAPARGSRLPE